MSDHEYGCEWKSISLELASDFHMLVSQLSRRVMHLWRHQQSIVASSTQRKQTEWETEPMCDNHLSIVRCGSVMYILPSRIMTSSNGNMFPFTDPLWGEGIHRWPLDSYHKSQWQGTLMFALICTWTNGWANNWSVYFDVTVMELFIYSLCWSTEVLFERIRAHRAV